MTSISSRVYVLKLSPSTMKNCPSSDFLTVSLVENPLQSEKSKVSISEIGLISYPIIYEYCKPEPELYNSVTSSSVNTLFQIPISSIIPLNG